MEDVKALLEKLAGYEQREQETNIQLQELTDFIENASLPMHWVDAKGIVIWANQAELDSLGYQKEEYIGQPIRHFHEDQHVITDILSRLANNETLYNYRSALKCKNGAIKHVLINSNVFRKDGEFVHTRCITRDITSMVEEERRKTNLLLELEERDARLKMAIESTNLGTWDFNPDSKILSWSDECRKIYGLQPEEKVSFDEFCNHIHFADKHTVLQEIEK